MKDSTVMDRAQFLRGIFPNGVPRLWCPPLTHYDSQGRIDAGRTAAHWKHFSPYVGGILVPGSTGDGWELDPAERRQLLSIALEQARLLNLQILIGTLHPDASKTLALVQEDVDWLKSQCGQKETAKALASARVCGFTVCAPRGRELTQDDIGDALSSMLELGLPTAIYQLPQVTLNEIGPQLASDLAQGYQNFIFFKDTSGSDIVVQSADGLNGVFAARGAEGDYARWLKINQGPYDGFLLASANCFAREMAQMIGDLLAGELEAALRLSERLTAVVQEVFKLAGAVSEGNPFANGNKAIDHFLAYGPDALGNPSPRLHAGSTLPGDLLRSTADILRREQLMPVQGYLEGTSG